jgi:hypothetical protein
MLSKIHTITNLAAGATLVHVHGLEATPTTVIPDRITPIVVVTVDATTVTFQNMGAGDESAIFRIRVEHSIVSNNTDALIWKGGPNVVFMGIGPLPPPSEFYRNTFRTTQGGSGVSDGTWQCQKTAADTYLWVPISPPVFGELWESSEPDGTLLTLTTGGTFYQWVSSTVGECFDVIGSAATDNLTVVTPGPFRIFANATFTGSSGVPITVSVFIDGVRSLKLSGTVTTVSSTFRTVIAFNAPIYLTMGQVIDLRFSALGNSKTINIITAELSLDRK